MLVIVSKSSLWKGLNMSRVDALAPMRPADLFRLVLVAILLGSLSGFAVADDGPDIQAIRERIELNNWSFEVDDHFTKTLTPERRANLRGYVTPPGYQDELDRHLKVYPVSRDDLPSNLDWRAVGGITAVKDQGECGSCWAFGATAELEAFVKIYYGVDTDLSEQQVVSCNPYGADCGGGWSTAAYYVFEHWGAVTEDCHPYLAADPPEAPCLQSDLHRYGFVTGYNYIANDVEQMKAALQYGPICTSIDASDEFEAYSGGCYDVPGGWTNHLVLIVGYDDRSCDGAGAWIIKNSWGGSFGENGFIWVQYGAGSVGTNVTQLEYEAPPVEIIIENPLGYEDLYGDQLAEIAWRTNGGAASAVDIWLGTEGQCHEVLVAENVPNTGSYEWTVPNLGTNFGSLVIFPSDGPEEGFVFSERLKIIGHKVRYVSSTGSNTPPYETPATAAHEINSAVAACTGTDTVMVAGGDYMGTVAVTSMVKLLGGWNEDFSARDPQTYPTRLQAGGSGVRFYESSGDFGLVDGFEFHDCIGGYTADPDNGQHGGGVYSAGASPTISNCVFVDNRASLGGEQGFGGAICISGGAPRVENCVFTGNAATKGGGIGMFNGSATTVSDCLFEFNTCNDSLGTFQGAALYVENSSLVLSGGSIRGNGGTGLGGAICANDGDITLSDVEIVNNRSTGAGGGIASNGGGVTLHNVNLVGNRALGGNGGGMLANHGPLSLYNVLFTDNQATGNGGGLSASSVSGQVENCLARGNTSTLAGGFFLVGSGPAAVRNNIVVDNNGGGVFVGGAELISDYNTVWNNGGGDYLYCEPGAHDRSLDPLFIDADGGNLALARYSPCVDAGLDDAGCQDPDGSRADMGLLGGPGAEFVAPAAVTGAVLTDPPGETVVLSWDAGNEPDLDHYVVYRDTAEVFIPTPSLAVGLITHPVTEFEDTPPYDCYYLVAAVDGEGRSGGYSDRVWTTGEVTATPDAGLPAALAIGSIAPNPFNPVTIIRYEVPRTGAVRLTVFDVRGRRVRDLVDGNVVAGRHEVMWDGRDDHGQVAAAGIYFARMTDGDNASTAKMVLAK